MQSRILDSMIGDQSEAAGARAGSRRAGSGGTGRRRGAPRARAVGRRGRRGPSGARLALAAGVLAALGAVASPVAALPLVGDETRLLLTGEGDLAALGVALEVNGVSNAGGLIGEAVLPITGGDVSFPLLTGTVEHGLSALRLIGPGFGALAASILLSAPILDLDLEEMTAIAESSALGLLPTRMPVFSLRSCLLSTGSDPCLDADGSILLSGFGLDWTGIGATLVNESFFDGEPVLAEGDRFAVAFPDLRPVPEPAGLWLLGLGLAALARRAPHRERP